MVSHFLSKLERFSERLLAENVPYLQQMTVWSHCWSTHSRRADYHSLVSHLHPISKLQLQLPYRQHYLFTCLNLELHHEILDKRDCLIYLCFFTTNGNIISNSITVHTHSFFKVYWESWQIKGLQTMQWSRWVLNPAHSLFHTACKQCFFTFLNGLVGQRNNNVLWHVKIIWNSKSVSLNKVLLEHSHAHSLPYCVWLRLPQWQS